MTVTCFLTRRGVKQRHGRMRRDGAQDYSPKPCEAGGKLRNPELVTGGEVGSGYPGTFGG
jgi:hypothetical protein